MIAQDQVNEDQLYFDRERRSKYYKSRKINVSIENTR
jgi:hypothetical protein